MIEVFRQIDADGSGDVDAKEVEAVFADPHVHDYISALEITVDNAQCLFRLLDVDRSGKVDMDEFIQGCLRLQGEATSVDVNTLIYQLKHFMKKWSKFAAFVDEKLSAQNSLKS